MWIVGIAGSEPVNTRIYDTLTVLQHRGQDAAGIATAHDGRVFLRKDNGLVKEVLRTRHSELAGHRHWACTLPNRRHGQFTGSSTVVREFALRTLDTMAI